MSDKIYTDRESMEYDVVIIGAGPSGLSCAIRLKQIDPSLSVCILEKGSEVGAHLLSGALLEPRALNELIPNWKEKKAPLTTPIKKSRLFLLNKKTTIPLMIPPKLSNQGNYIISLANFGRWLAEQAEEMGVEIFPGFAAAEILYHDDGSVKGVATGDMGLDKDGNKTKAFQQGIELHAGQTVFAEGCHGSLTKSLIEKFDLRKNSNPQTYGLGIKEIWNIKPENHKKGRAIHTIGWPLSNDTYGGGFLYHMENHQVSIGFVIGLDYKNPHLSPYEEMQRFKHHPKIRNILQGGSRVAYGARTLVEGGLQSLPKLTFPGGLLIGDTAGFLNVPKIKGIHTAMKSGMVAADSLLGSRKEKECFSYTENLKESWVWKELYEARNIRSGFQNGLLYGIFHTAFQLFGGWRLPYTLKNKADHTQLEKASSCHKIEYPKPDDILTFDRLSSVQFSNTTHQENQPCHLKLKDPDNAILKNLEDYNEPAQRYCPTGVYEIIKNTQGQYKLQINAQNCVHCKCCDIKDPAQNIEWVVPQGGDGPNYPNM